MAAAITSSSEDQPTSYRPAGTLDLATALQPYAGLWSARQAAHLYRRAGFGGTPDDVAKASAAGMRAAVDALIHFPDTSSLPAQPALVVEGLSPEERRQFVQLRMAAQGTTLSDQTSEQFTALRKLVNRGKRQNAIALQTWFVDRMLRTPAPLQEKMTLFWHGHFTSAMQKGITGQQLADQNNLFRANALGNIRTLTLAVSQDPAMLRYLDNAQNFKAHPNENYARELMELFTLGIGNYTETDIRESARAFTGWRIGRDGRFFDDRAQHDDGSKTFLGRTGNFDGHDIVGIIFQQPAAARWFANKLLNFYVYNDPEPGLIDAVAAELRRHDFELQPVMATLLRSNVFYSDRAYRALVKSPVEFVVGSAQLFGVSEVDLPMLAAINRMGQRLFYPPDVKGWDGGAKWLNSQTLLVRENFASALMTKMNDAAWLGNAVSSMDPQHVARDLTTTILQGDVSASSTAKLVAYLGGTGEAALGSLSGENAQERVRGAAYLTMAMPAYQLA
jgi:uncharacterized protein (DUF1800 family)